MIVNLSDWLEILGLAEAGKCHTKQNKDLVGACEQV